jgi:hypothetical protein
MDWRSCLFNSENPWPSLSNRFTSLTDSELEQLSRTNAGIRFERGTQGELIVSPTGTLGGFGKSELFSH